MIEDDKAWYVEHRFLSTERAKAVTRGINDRCRLLRPHAELLVDGFGIPESLRYADMLHPEKLPEAGADEADETGATDSALLNGNWLPAAKLTAIETFSPMRPRGMPTL